jgi:hypothetical protein
VARRAADPSARIAHLKAAREMVQPGEVLNAQEFAAAAGMSWRMLKQMIDQDEGWPIKVRGSEGSGWQIEAVPAIDHMIAHYQGKLAERRANMERLRDLAGIEAPVVSPELSISDLRALDQIQNSVQRRKIEQGLYVLASEHREIIGDLMVLFREETMGLIGRVDAAGRWPEGVREEVVEDLRNMLVRTHDKAAVHLGADAQ